MDCYIILKSVFFTWHVSLSTISIFQTWRCNLLQRKKRRWGRLSQISRGKLSQGSWLSMRAFSWMIGPDIVSALSPYCYHSSIQTNIVTRFWWFFSANSSFFTFLNMSSSLLITRFHRQTVNCIDALAFTFYFLITYGVCKKRKYCFISS